MTAEQIKKIRDRKEKARERQYRNYQDSGEGMYYSKAKQYEQIVEICDQALTVAKDREKCRKVQNDIIELADMAKKAEVDCHCCGGLTPVVLNKIMALASSYGWRG